MGVVNVPSCSDFSDFVLEALYGNQLDFDHILASCDAFPFVVSSFKDPPCSVVCDTPVQPSVGGRLRKCIIFGVPYNFPSLSEMLFVKATKLFLSASPPFSEASNASARANNVFVSQAVNDLL